MGTIPIHVEGLGKKYHIGKKQEQYQTLRDTLSDAFVAPFRRAGKLLRGQATGAAELDETIWALKDISFDIKQGEVVGIIGHNGAGKSTLLKILSRITEPTEGFAELRGRIGSLLEVGTGFHPELTGRENIYLNGAILGMRRHEINRKFDEIVAFAEVEKFMDTPVKFYSSGMYLRLAFAVASHLETEILLVDEVLAVGDASFQKKCIGKMEQVSQKGRTILFVSHNMGAIENLCTSALWIDRGRISLHDDVYSAISAYLKSDKSLGTVNPKRMKLDEKAEAHITDVRLLTLDGSPCSAFSMGESLVVEFDVNFHRSFEKIDISLEIKRVDMGLHVLHMLNQDCGLSLANIDAGKESFRVEIPDCMLYPTSYKISIWMGDRGSGTLAYLSDILSFSMFQSGVTKRTTPLSMHKSAIFYIPTKWKRI